MPTCSRCRGPPGVVESVVVTMVVSSTGLVLFTYFAL
jgi:hypothetical protein